MIFSHRWFIRKANYNTWILKFDNFSEFQNVIFDSPPNLERHYEALHTIIDMWLTPNCTDFTSPQLRKHFMYVIFFHLFLYIQNPGFQNCSCISRTVRKNNLNRSTLPPPASVMNMTMNEIPNNYKTSYHLTEGSATFGACDRGCKNFGVFIALIIPMLFIAFLAATPHKILVLR